MRKYFIGSFIALALFVGGVSVSAAALTESQIQAIMGLLTSFGAEASIVSNVDVSLHGGTPAGSGNSGSGEMCPAIARVCKDNVPPTHASGCRQICPEDGNNGGVKPTLPGNACPLLMRALTLGSRGDDVIKLQNFLSQDTSVGFSAGATGYFGPATLQALQKWQAKEGVVTSGSPETTGFGAVGPKTREQIMRRCGGVWPPPPPSAGRLQAMPTSGNAPLTVEFSTSLGINDATSTFSVDFGDGSSDEMQKGSCVGIAAVQGGQGGIRCSYNTSHIYKTNGTYTAKLTKVTAPACYYSNPRCLIAISPQVVGSAIIKVGSVEKPPISTSLEMKLQARPTSGTAPLTVNFKTTTNPQTSSGDFVVDFGDGTSAPMESDGMAGICEVGAGGPCNGYNGLVAEHTYKTNGTYTAKLMYDNCPANAQCFVGPRVLDTVTITVGGTVSQDGALRATPTSGTAPLKVVFNWKGSPTTIDFGDGTVEGIVVPAIYPAPTQGSLTHTYTTAGTYTATLQADRCGRGYEGTPRCLAPIQLLASVKITVR